MIIKSRDSRDEDISTLETLLKGVEKGSKEFDQISRKLAFLHAGIGAEKEVAYHLDFRYRDADDMAVIHDFRIECGGRVAQIDHLLIHRSMNVFVVETKRVRAGIKVNEKGEFLRWDEGKERYSGMASPLAQNEEHILVLRDALAKIASSQPLNFISVIAVSKGARIIAPHPNIVNSDQLAPFVEEMLSDASHNSDAHSLSRDELGRLARDIAALHVPKQINYAAKFGVQGKASTVSSSSPRKPARFGLGAAIAFLAVITVMYVMLFQPPGNHEQGVKQQPAETKKPIAADSGRREKAEEEQRQHARSTGRSMSVAMTGVIKEGEDCFAQKRYDCAISSANAALRIESGNVLATGLKRRAEQAQAQAMNAIAIQ